VQYRIYEPEDFDALYAIEEVCFQPPHRFSRGYMRELLGQSNTAAWIAVQDDGLVRGFGILDWAQEHAQVVAYVQTLELLPAYRGLGAGSELLRCMERSAAIADAAEVWLHVDAENAAAIRLYEQTGYRLEGKERNYYGRGRAGLVYRKRLARQAGSIPSAEGGPGVE
jgi:ribosomal protein S18 acetylase RimI-like enzyme